VATSANRSGGPDPRTAGEVLEALDGDVDLVIDGGEAGGVPSTVVRVDGSRFEILRAGAITEDELRLLAVPTVLFVCRGNTCRSPLAGALFAKELEARCRTDVTVLSAGVDVATGDSLGASALALEAAAGAGLDLAGHEVRSLTSSILARADWVFVMERSQIAGITSLLPEEADHIRLLDPAGGDIADPSGGDPDDYRRSLDAIHSGVRARAREILDETDLQDEGAAA